LTIIRKDSVLIPKGDTIIQPDDEIIALTKITQEREVVKCLLGEI